MTVLLNRSYTAGHFLLTLQGAPDFGFLKSVEGGGVTGAVLKESIGPDLTAHNHLGPVQTSEITVQVGLEMGWPLWNWLKDSFTKKYTRKSGSLIHADFNYKARHEQIFTEALITEVAIPKLDGQEKAAGYLTLKILPETVKLKKSGGQPLRAEFPARQKVWNPCNFRLSIDGVNCKGVSTVDSFTIKQKVQRLFTGEGRKPQLEPSQIEFPNLSIHCSLAKADDFISWHDKFVVAGERDPSMEKTGQIELLAPDLKEVLMTIKLFGLGIFNLTVNKHDAANPAIHRCKIEMYCERMEFVKKG